jgi:hypothetical protein
VEEVTKLNIEKAVDDAIRRTEGESGRSISFGGTVNSDAIGADVKAGLGKGWSLAAIYRRWRTGSGNREGAIRITKEFE